MGRGPALTGRHLRLRRDAGRLRAALGEAWRRVSRRRLRDHEAGPRGLRRRPYVRTHAYFASARRCRTPETGWPELNRELFALIDARLEAFADAVEAVAELRRARRPDRGRVLLGARAAGPHARPRRPVVRDHDRGRRGRARQARAGHVPRGRASASELPPERCVVVEDSAAGRRRRPRGRDADARRLPRPRDRSDTREGGPHRPHRDRRRDPRAPLKSST